MGPGGLPAPLKIGSVVGDPVSLPQCLSRCVGFWRRAAGERTPHSECYRRIGPHVVTVEANLLSWPILANFS